MKVWRLLTLTIVLVSVSAPLLAAFTAWIPPALQRGILAFAPPAAGAILVVVYFNWRDRLKSRILADSDADDDLARAA